MADNSCKFLINKRKEGIAKVTKNNTKNIELPQDELTTSLILALKYDDDILEESLELMEKMDMLDISMTHWEKFIEKDNEKLKESYSYLKKHFKQEELDYELVLPDKKELMERMKILENFEINKKDLRDCLSTNTERILENKKYISEQLTYDKELDVINIINNNPKLLRLDPDFLKEYDFEEEVS